MKNIVICCDGTGNEYGKNNTNVVETYGLAMKTGTQLAYYDPGVGTGGWAYNEESGVLRALSDQGTGAGLQQNVNDAYRYLMEVYEGPEANRIFLFGFRRGAFTARSLAGTQHKVGLLERNADNHLEYAAKVYNQPRNAASPPASRRPSAGRHPCTSSASGTPSSRWCSMRGSAGPTPG